MSAVKLITIFAENKLGQIAAITETLAKANINIRGINIATSEAFGVVKCLVDNYESAYTELKKKKFTVSLNEVLAVEVQDKPGALHEIAKILEQNKINIENASGIVANKRAVILIEVNDLPGALKTLQKHKVLLLDQKAVMGL